LKKKKAETSWKGNRQQENGADEGKTIAATAAGRKSLFAGAAPVVLKSVRSVSAKINGESAMVRPGYVRTVNVSISWNDSFVFFPFTFPWQTGPFPGPEMNQESRYH